MRTLNQCKKCFYQWFGENPQRCANCYSNKWNRELEGPDKIKDDEEWKDIAHINNYKVSNYGRVYSLLTDKIITKGGSKTINIHGKVKTISHLMLDTFYPDVWKSKKVRYIDGNNENIKLSNIEWY